MTNPGYKCERKRKRDIFMLNSLFGGNAVPMVMMGGDNSHRGMIGNTDGIYGHPQNNNNEGSNQRGSPNPFGALLITEPN